MNIGRLLFWSTDIDLGRNLKWARNLFYRVLSKGSKLVTNKLMGQIAQFFSPSIESYNVRSDSYKHSIFEAGGIVNRLTAVSLIFPEAYSDRSDELNPRLIPMEGLEHFL